MVAAGAVATTCKMIHISGVGIDAIVKAITLAPSREQMKVPARVNDLGKNRPTEVPRVNSTSAISVRVIDGISPSRSNPNQPNTANEVWNAIPMLTMANIATKAGTTEIHRAGVRALRPGCGVTRLNP